MLLFLLPPQRGMIIENGFAKPIDSIAIGKRLQDLETIFHVPEIEVQDIENEGDGMIEEIKYKLLMKGKERKHIEYYRTKTRL